MGNVSRTKTETAGEGGLDPTGEAIGVVKGCYRVRVSASRFGRRWSCLNSDTWRAEDAALVREAESLYCIKVESRSPVLLDLTQVADKRIQGLHNIVSSPIPLSSSALRTVVSLLRQGSLFTHAIYISFNT